MPAATEVSVSQMESVVDQIGETYGPWQNSECDDLRLKLLEIEDGGATGRVRLVDFYRDAIEGGNWQFCERPEYLKQLGALDDSDPSVAKLIIPNYVHGLSN